jgi:tetratricopeptide (TPR) repeat protein
MRSVFVSLILFGIHAAALASDQDSIDLAKAAMAANDCPLAARTLDALSPPAKQDPGVLFLMARANECAGNVDAALEYYRRYDAVAPNIPEVRDAIGKLLLKIEERRRALEEQERQRIEKERNDAAAAEWQRQQDIEYKKRADAQARVQAWENDLESRRNIAKLAMEVPVHVGLVVGGLLLAVPNAGPAFEPFELGDDPSVKSEAEFLFGGGALLTTIGGTLLVATAVFGFKPVNLLVHWPVDVLPAGCLFMPPAPSEAGAE